MWFKIIISLTVLALTFGAPQFEENTRPMPYSFGYGVNNPETQDEKEHKETQSESGRTEGMYRWLQPNGLYRVVRYYVDGDSGFVAEVSEEPGPAITNYYANDLAEINQASSSGQSFSTSQRNQESSGLIQSQVNTQAQVQPVIATVQNQQQRFTTSNQQSFVSEQANNQQFSQVSQNSFNNNLNFQNSFSNQQSFSSQQENRQKSFESSFLQTNNNLEINNDIIQGEIIDGGIINPEDLEF